VCHITKYALGLAQLGPSEFFFAVHEQYTATSVGDVTFFVAESAKRASTKLKYTLTPQMGLSRGWLERVFPQQPQMNESNA
jgi:hypothetical protein